jgi:hypothetical protein
MSPGAELLNGVSSGRRVSRSTVSSGCPSSISIAVTSAVVATLLAARSRAMMALASLESLPMTAAACSRQKVQPPSRVSVLDPGEMCPSPHPTRPLPSRTSTMIGSNSVKVR